MPNWNDAMITEFRQNDGHTKQFGDGLVLLHTTGAKTGREHLVPTAGLPDGGDGWYVVASKAGAPDNPDWYYNLLANPEITIERRGSDGIETVRVRAADLTGPERDQAWAGITALAPGFADYQTKTSRVIPVVRLSRV